MTCHSKTTSPISLRLIQNSLWDQRVLKVPLDQLVHKAQLELQVHKGLRGRLEQPVQLVRKGLLAVNMALECYSPVHWPS